MDDLAAVTFRTEMKYSPNTKQTFTGCFNLKEVEQQTVYNATG